MKDAKATLSGIPKTHAALIKGYKFIFQPDNTLKGDESHVGVIDDVKKTIILSAPWHHSREFVMLHELAHRIWAKLPKKKQEEWNKIAKDQAKKVKDGLEETFCHCYANYHASNPVKKFENDKIEKFIAELE